MALYSQKNNVYSSTSLSSEIDGYLQDINQEISKKFSISSPEEFENSSASSNSSGIFLSDEHTFNNIRYESDFAQNSNTIKFFPSNNEKSSRFVNTFPSTLSSATTPSQQNTFESINQYRSNVSGCFNGQSKFIKPEQHVAPQRGFGLKNCQPNYLEEKYSRKVFVGGLPPDIDEEEINSAFKRFGLHLVDWPHKADSKSLFPPKGYCFLLFQEELSVQYLMQSCIFDEDKYYWCVSSPTFHNKMVQIRPWNLTDSDFIMDESVVLNPRQTIFVGGVPRPLRASELAHIMNRLYGGVCYAGIDIDPDLKYPKGAGRVVFSNQKSYIAAISARFVQLHHKDIDKRVEVKPYVLDDQICSECNGSRCDGKFAPFFCANVSCLQYYCEFCWSLIHSRQGKEFHKPLVKEGSDRPRAVPLRV